MILHLGADYIVPLCEVIAIIDAQTVAKSKDTKKFVNICTPKKVIMCCKEGETKSYVLSKRKGELCIYTSAISSQTLLKRTNLSAAVKAE